MRKAIGKSPGLVEILKEARRLDSDRKKANNKRNPVQSDRNKAARVRNRSDHFESSALRRAGKSEEDLRESCSSCGMMVDPATSDDC